MTHGLNNCPVCHSTPYIMKEGIGYVARCNYCGERGSLAFTEEKAIYHWNRCSQMITVLNIFKAILITFILVAAVYAFHWSFP